MEKEYAVLLPAEGQPEVVEFKAKEEGIGYYYKTIGCDIFDIVHTVKEGFCLVVDDEGLFKEKPKINVIASLLYGALEHGQPLVGNALLCADKDTPDGVETVGFTQEKASHIADTLKRLVFSPVDQSE